MDARKELTQAQIERLLTAHRETPDWPRSVVNAIFGRTVKKNDKGEVIGVNEQYIRAFDEFFLPANTLPNQKEGIQTTAGRFFFNSYVLVGSFGDKISYVNEPVTDKKLESILNEATEGLQMGRIKEEELNNYMNKIFRIGFLTEVFNPGMNTKFLKPLPEVEKLKKELFEKYKDEIEEGNAAVYADKVEKPLLEKAREILREEDCWSIYASGALDDKNNLKNNTITVGGLIDPVNNKFNIIKNSYYDGLDPSEYPTHANKLIAASYNRAVETQYGGAKTKFLFAAMQNIIAGPKGSDCGTKRYLETVIQKAYKKDYLFRYVIDGNNLVLLTPDVIDKYLDRPIKLRSPLYCEGKNICNKCLGDLFYILGITNIGLTATRTTASIMQIAMKSMHDVTIKTVEVNPYDFMTWVKK